MPDKDIKLRDPSSSHEPGASTEREINYRAQLEEYFDNSPGSLVERLENFSKYVPRQKLTEFIAKYELFKKVLTVQGSVIECGVFHGGGLMTFAQLSSIFEPVNHKRKIIGFDTFAGFASLSSEDLKGSSGHAVEGGFSIDSYDDLESGIQLFDMNRSIGHIPKVMLIKGDIRKTLPNYLEDNPQTVVSLLHLDMDVYEPTKFVLELLIPRMPKGAIIFFDELNDERWPGETSAVVDTIGIHNLRIERFVFDASISYAVIE